jgi:endonuclease/exonuclease/phosphatase family metal-dependent hydrolase
MKLTIVSLNCYGIPLSLNKKIRFNLIAQEITRINPDVVMLQEVWFKSNRSILEKQLSQKGWIFSPNIFSTHGPGGLLLITKGLSINKCLFYKFKDQGPIRISSIADRIGGKGFQFISLQKGESKFSIINSHLLSNHKGETQSIRSHSHQLNQLREFTNGLSGPVILGGDLNTDSDTQKTKTFKNELKLSEKLSEKEFTIDPKNLNRKRAGNVNSHQERPHRCDYIFVNSMIKMSKEKVIFKDPLLFGEKLYHLSDHYGLSAEVNLK